jgi:hypothetical protein
VPGLIGTQTLLDYAERAGVELPRDLVLDPADLVTLALDGLEAGQTEILDEMAVEAKASLSGPPRAFSW